jgi:hypothetical protein
MGKLSKLMAKAEELANKELNKLNQQQQAGAAQQQSQQQHPGQAYAPPVIIPAPQYAAFSTPPPSPPPYTTSVFAERPSTPPAQPTQPQFVQQQQQVPLGTGVSPTTPQPEVPSPISQPTLTPSPNAGRGRKKALLIACSYPGTKAQLRGPANDNQCMQVSAALQLLM